MSDMWWINSASEEVWGQNIGPTIMTNVHDPARCEGRGCVIHHPSDHHMRSWPTHWRADRYLMERMCLHGVGHPDPDDVAYQDSVMPERAAGVHGCDGCCHEMQSDL